MGDKKIKEIEEELKGNHAGKNYNFFRPVGQFIEHVDTINFSMDKDGKFYFENIGQVNGAPSRQIQLPEEENKEELFHFIHPEIKEEEAWDIHNSIKRLVPYQRVQEICAYLKELKKKGKVLLPPSPSVMYNELVRLGMPTCEGYSEKNFKNYYMQ